MIYARCLLLVFYFLSFYHFGEIVDAVALGTKHSQQQQLQYGREPESAFVIDGGAMNTTTPPSSKISIVPTQEQDTEPGTTPTAVAPKPVAVHAFLSEWRDRTTHPENVRDVQASTKTPTRTTHPTNEVLVVSKTTETKVRLTSGEWVKKTSTGYVGDLNKWGWNVQGRRPKPKHTAAADYEIWAIAKEGANVTKARITHHQVGYDITADDDHIQGHYALLHNPINHFSIVEPPSGCNATTGDREKTTINAAAHHCTVATNGGFWEAAHDGQPATGNCLGNLVSDGRLVQVTGRHTVQFAVKGAHIYVGYLHPDMIVNKTSEPISQLVAGLGWLVRDGKNYVSQSMKEEDMSQQETGPHFADIRSGRTALGHDKYGRIVLFQIDGKSWKRGVSLYTMADLLIGLDVVNAINLDGGGSTTWSVNGTLSNYVSDECVDENGSVNPNVLCERPITTITCMHDV